MASAFVSTKLNNVTEGLDTDSGFVNQTSGEALGASGVGVLTFGGPFVNPIVKRAENSSTPEEDRAPIQFVDMDGQGNFQYANGTAIPNASLPWWQVNDDRNMFII